MEKDNRDVGFVHDFIFYLQNAVALEHHAIESYALTKDHIMLEIAEKARRNRSKKMYSFVKESKNQIYCMSKHLMACAQALKEMGNRYLETGEPELASECFDESQQYESIFIIINEKEGK